MARAFLPGVLVLKHADLRGGDLRLTRIDDTVEAVDLDLKLSVSETWENGLGMSLQYSSDSFEHSTVERMLGHLQVLLEMSNVAPEKSISEISLLSGKSGEHVVRGCGSPRR